jgi:hypothetical protein
VKPLSAASTIEEIAAAVSSALREAGITAVLSGGGAVQIYSSGLYASKDLDFVSPADHREIAVALRTLGFVRESGRHFVHPDCTHTVEFPAWPLAVGRQLIREWGNYPVGERSIQILTPTQCVMDRLAAFYHWRDRQALDQAVAVADRHAVDLAAIHSWSLEEGHDAAHQEFRRALARLRDVGANPMASHEPYT